VTWEGRTVCVTGLAVSGFAAADALLQLGAHVVVVDRRDDGSLADSAEILRDLGADVRLGADAVTVLPEGTDLVVSSPGWRDDVPLLAAARAAAVPVWSEVQLAWQVQSAERRPAWLTLTGTNGKTTTVEMLAAMLTAAGHRAVAAGNVGTPVVEAVLAERPYDVLAVELSSFQLHRTVGLRPVASAVLNVAPDHIDWHGSLAAYAADKGRVYAGTTTACVYNVADPTTERLLRDADVVEGCRAVGFTLGVPAVGALGVVDDVLVDRAFGADRTDSAVELATLDDVQPLAPHNVENALAAAALARAYGVPPTAVRDGLRGFRAGAHRIAIVAEAAGVTYVDDSKATNPHAAVASLSAYRSVVWIAGGLAKGATFDDLVLRTRDRLRAVVLLGQDRAVVRAALARHAPDLPVVEVASTETGAMDDAVRAAASLAVAGDTVLLAPGCASMDLFRDYAARGDAFAAAVHALPGTAR
jgi:UDP-N-acetylmuramoylalanine--D-glutamate ligase